MVTVALRYSQNIHRDFRRGHSFAEWGIAPYATRRECAAEWPHHQPRYSRELAGWLPAHEGLCAAAIADGDNFDQAVDYALENMRVVDGMDDAGVPLWAFECTLVGFDPYGWPLVRPTGRPVRVR
jgi:hypothetical protein